MAKGDQDVAGVVGQISSQLNIAGATTEQKRQHEDQILQQADLEARQFQEKRDMERRLEDDLHNEKRTVDDNIDEQRKLVRTAPLIHDSLKEKKTQSKCMFRLGDDDIESPYKKFLDTFDFFV